VQGIASGIQRVPDLLVEFTVGTFSDLSRITRNVEVSSIFMAPFPSRATITQYGMVDLPPLVVSFREVVSHIPDLSQLYETTFGERAATFPGLVFLLIGSGDIINTAQIMVFETPQGLPSEDTLIESLKLRNVTEQGFAASHHFFGNTNHRWFHLQGEVGPLSVEDLPSLSNDAQGNIFLRIPLQGSVSLSVLSLLFLFSYFMGMMARYFPSKWLALLNRSKGDFTLPLINKALALVEQRFPELALAQLDRPSTVSQLHIPE
jgi:hypothetical protein